MAPLQHPVRYLTLASLLLIVPLLSAQGCPSTNPTPPADEVTVPPADDGTTPPTDNGTVQTGIVLETVAGAINTSYDIKRKPTNELVLSSVAANQTVALAPGSYLLTQAGNSLFAYASEVAVTEGSVTRVTMGALQYMGTLNYDIFTNGVRVSLNNAPTAIVTAPAGLYLLTEHLAPDRILKGSIFVVAGQTTIVPQ